MRSFLIILTLASATASGCATKSGTGTVVGGAAGAAIGGLAGGGTGMLIGAIAGGALGYATGRVLEEEDRRRAAIALEQDRAMTWHNAHTGAEYRMVPGPSSYVEGRRCREFQMYAEVDGKPDTITGTACRRPDGTWEAMSG